MRCLKFQICMAVLAALSALLRPVVRWVVQLAGRLSYWRTQAEIGLFVARAEGKVQRQRGQA
ncbi:MAG: hypothetical protein ABL896_14170 [Hylemonella sp.]